MSLTITKMRKKAMYQNLKDKLKKILPKKFMNFYRFYRYPLHRKLKISFGEKYIYKDDEGSELIYKKLLKGKACFVGRFGWLELETVLSYVRLCEKSKIIFDPELKRKMNANAGFFPADDKKLSRFSYESLQVLADTDILAVCFSRGDEVLVEKFAPNVKLVEFSCIGDDLAFYENPWSRYLKDKKVLVIHPFADTIKKQYTKRKLLFKNPEVLPEFELINYKPIQSAGDASKSLPYSDWFEVLEHMQNDISKIDFDIALVGAGAYGFFLGHFCKSLGKQAVHVGGALQLLFGIKGARWVNEYPAEFGKALFNDHWIFPNESERPPGAEKIESACYW